MRDWVSCSASIWAQPQTARRLPRRLSRPAPLPSPSPSPLLALPARAPLPSLARAPLASLAPAAEASGLSAEDGDRVMRRDTSRSVVNRRCTAAMTRTRRQHRPERGASPAQHPTALLTQAVVTWCSDVILLRLTRCKGADCVTRIARNASGRSPARCRTARGYAQSCKLHGIKRTRQRTHFSPCSVSSYAGRGRVRGAGRGGHKRKIARTHPTHTFVSALCGPTCACSATRSAVRVARAAHMVLALPGMLWRQTERPRARATARLPREGRAQREPVPPHAGSVNGRASLKYTSATWNHVALLPVAASG